MKKIFLTFFLLFFMFSCSTTDKAMEARDLKRISDIENLGKIISIESVKGADLKDYMIIQKQNKIIIGGEEVLVPQGVLKIDKVGEFLDPLTGEGYIFAYVTGKTSSGEFYSSLQLAASLEKDNIAKVVGYHNMLQNGDSPSLITNDNGEFVVNEGNILPYKLEKSTETITNKNQIELSTDEKIEVVEKMIDENKNGFLACKTIVSNYKTKQQSNSQWQEFADSWGININQAKYLVEKCEGVNLTGTSFLPGLLENLKNGNVVN